ncbi:MAG: LPS export ABC transporter permease LptG [Pseudomonadota bacterium]
MGLIERYVATNFLKGMAIVLMLLLVLFSFLSLTESLEDVGQGSFTTADAFFVTLFELPALVIELLPVSALIGSLIGLGALANHHELTAMRALGVSPSRVVMAVVKVVLIISILVPALQNLVIPESGERSVALQAKTVGGAIQRGGESALWTRGDASILRVGQLLYGRIPFDIEIYQLTESGRLAMITRAEQADIGQDGEWLLRDVRQTEVKEKGVTSRRLDRLAWPGLVPEEQLSAFIIPARDLPTLKLYRYIERLESNGLNAHYFRIVLYQQLGFPVTMLALSLLGLPFVMGSVRRLSAGTRVAMGAVMGVLVYLAEKITEDVALLLEWDPMPAALMPELLFLVLAAVAIRWVM